MWLLQLELLSDHHHVMLLDLPGYGLAEAWSVPDPLSGFSDTVYRTLTSQFPTSVVVVGHSFGGYVALQLFRDHPEVFAGLVLTNRRSEPDTPEMKEKRLATVRRLEDPAEALDVEATARALVTPPTWNAGGPIAESVRSMVRRARSPAIRGAPSAIATRPDLTPVLSAINVPTLVLWGEEDQLIPPLQTQSMVARLSEGIGVGIPGAGHLPSLEAPELFGRSLAHFLARIYPTESSHGAGP